MMTIDEIIPAVLNTIVSGQVWQDATPDDLPRDTNGVIKPFIIWQIMGGTDAQYYDGSMPSHSNARIQIISVAPGAVEASTIARLARDALLASAYNVGVLGSPVGTYDASRKLRARRQQFSIWFRQDGS